MKKLNATDIKELNLLKHYRLIRKWACRNNDLNDAKKDDLCNKEGFSTYNHQE